MIDEKDANIVVHRNQYYDIHMCFGLMHRYWGNNMPDEISDWLEDYLLNDQIPSADRDERILEAKEYTNPAKILNTDFFTQFTKKPASTSSLKAKFTGVLKKDIEYDFEDNKNRYTDPKTCQYQHFVFLDPKRPSLKEKNDFENRYLCNIASKSNNFISHISVQQFEKMEKWALNILNEYTVSSVSSDNEKNVILFTTMNLFHKFSDRNNVTSDLLHTIL